MKNKLPSPLKYAVAISITAVSLGGMTAHAADAIWNVNSDGNWATNANWTPAASPGSTSSTTNTDTATFGTIVPSGTTRTITVDANRNIFGISFNGNSGVYVLSGGNLLLTAGGLLQTSGGGSIHTDTINSAITLEGDYTFGTNSTTTGRILAFGSLATITSAATTGTTTLTLNGTGTSTNNAIAGVISNGTGTNKVALSKSGTGTWVLSGVNTFTGATSISGGTLSIAADSGLGAAPVSATANMIVLSNGGKLSYTTAGNGLNVNRGITLGTGGGTLEFTNIGASADCKGLITGSGLLTLSTAGTGGQLSLGTNDYSGGTNIVAGSRLAILTSSSGSPGSLSSGPFGTGTITILSGASAVQIRPSTTGGTRTLGNAISLGGDLTRGATSATGQDLVYSGPVTITGASRTLANVDTNSNKMIFSGVIGDGGNNFGLTIAGGTSTIQFSGSNTFTGGVTITTGTLLLGNAGALNSTTGSENAVTFGASSTGILSLGGKTVTVSNLSSNATPGTPVVENANATSATLTVGNSSNLSGTYAGVIQNGTGAGTLGLTKAGSGTLTVSGANTYSGGTTISAGKFLANNTSGSATGTGAVAVNGGLLGGTGLIVPTSGGVTVASGASIAPGASIGTLTINLGSTSGGVTMNSGSTFTFELGSAGVSLAAPGTSDVLALTGASVGDFIFNNNTVNISGGSTGFYKLFDTDLANATLAGDSWQNLTYDPTTGLISSGLVSTGNDFYVGTASNGGSLGDIYLNIVPEPSTWSALLGGMGILVGAQSLRRRRIN